MKNVIQIFSQKHLISNQHFKFQNIRQNKQNFVTMFSFQPSQITQKEFEY